MEKQKKNGKHRQTKIKKEKNYEQCMQMQISQKPEPSTKKPCKLMLTQ